MQTPYDREVAVAALMLDDTLACRRRVLSALEELMQFDDDRELRTAVRRRYCDLTGDDSPTEFQAKASEDNGATGEATMRPADCMAGEASRLAAGQTAAPEAACPVSPHGMREAASTNPGGRVAA